MADVLAFRVGRRYPAKRLRFPMPEASQYSFDKRGHLLQLFWSGPLPRETKAVREGEARFALAAEGPGIFLCYRFGDMAWGGSPCSVHLVPETRRTTTGLDPETGEPRNLLEIHLVDASSGILRAMRFFWLDRTFTDAFEEALRGQVAAGWAGREAYESALAGVYRRYPRSSDLARVAVARSDFPRVLGA